MAPVNEASLYKSILSRILADTLGRYAIQDYLGSKICLPAKRPGTLYEAQVYEAPLHEAPVHKAHETKAHVYKAHVYKAILSRIPANTLGRYTWLFD